MKKLLLSLLSVIGSAALSQAQTVSTFEDIYIADTNKTINDTIPNNTAFSFTDGNATFYGQKYSSNYNTLTTVSHDTATVGTYPDGMYGNITGHGYNNSNNFGLTYISSDENTNYLTTIPVGVTISGTAAHHPVQGIAITNSTYAYNYITETPAYTQNGGWFKLIIKGYNNGVASADSVLFTLADYSNPDSIILINDWKWVDLTSLGDVDSLTFDLTSTDTVGGYGSNTPSYFAFDNLTTSDGLCDNGVTGLAVTETTSGTLLAQWNPSSANATYDVSIDTVNALAPLNIATTTTDTFYSQSGLSPNTTYYVHIRNSCGSNYASQWDTLSFTTQAVTGVENIGNELNISLYPNPATSQNIHLINANNTQAVIYDYSGKEVLRKNNHLENIDISGLSAGVYFIKLQNAKGNATLKFSKI